jgi:hypothetical protein
MSLCNFYILFLILFGYGSFFGTGLESSVVYFEYVNELLRSG